MMRRVWLLVIGVLVPVGGAKAQGPSYAREVRPLLTRYCAECHTGADAEAGLNLETHKTLMEGGGRGASVVPGKPDASLLVRMVEGTQKPVMPPKKSRQPTPAEKALLRAWVAAGARDDSKDVRITLSDIAPRRSVPTPVTALAYTPDGKLLAVSGRGGVLFVDSAAGELRHRLGGVRERVSALACSGSGLLAVASGIVGDGSDVRLVSLDAAGKLAGEPRVTLRHDDVIHALAFSPDGTLLASCGYDRLVKLWDVKVGKELHVLKDHSDSVYSVSFSPDGKWLASAGADRAVKVWEVATGTRLYTLGESTDWVYAVAFSPDGKHLAAAGVDRSIRVWEVNAGGGRIVYSVFAHEGPINRLAYSADGKTLYSLCEDGSAKAWDTARMVERHIYPRQPETPLCLAVSPDHKQLAVGRYDGALVLLDEATGKEKAVRVQAVARPASAAKATALRAAVTPPPAARPQPPVLSRLSPASGVRGRSITLELEGKNLLGATEVTAPLPGWKAVILPGATPEKLRVQVEFPAGAAAGSYAVKVRTPGGESGAQPFILDLFPAVSEKEPNDSPRTGQPIILPASISGSISRAGDADFYTFTLEAGQEVGVQALTTALGSKLAPILTLRDPEGAVVVQGANGLLGYRCPRRGTYALGIRDRDYRGDGSMSYRLHVGTLPVVTSVFPLGVQRGKEPAVRLDGVHLGKERTVKLKVAGDVAPGTRLPVPFLVEGNAPLGARTVVVGEFPEVQNEDAGGTLTVPGTANGVISKAGSSQVWRFSARKGERLLLEVEAARLGSPLDSLIEVLDDKGKPLPRAVLRCLAKTYTTFRDHDSRSGGIRLEAWSELAINDYLLVGSELLRIRELPRNPDDDCQFFSEGGQRLGFLGTTPTHHPAGEAMYKVAIHPPGTTFSPNGLPVVTLYHRNDDGGPGFGKDSRLVFDPPADGTYAVRVSDTRGEGGPGHAYRLTVRAPRPDFKVSFTPTAPAVFKGGAAPIRVSVQRIDEFDGEVRLKLHGLPPGFHAPETAVLPGDNSTAFALFAEAGARLPDKPTPLKLEAVAHIGGKDVSHEAVGGVPRLIEPGDIVTTTEQSEVTIRPGDQTKLTVRVERRNGFKGRIPLEVLGLPHGVRVLDVGLNGILITETESVRTFALYAEPWVAATDHPIVVLARREGKNSEHAARSVLLRVEGKK